MFLSKSDFINLCKSMGKDPEFEKLRAEVLSILKKQAKTEGNEKDIHKSLLEMDKSFKYFDKDEFIIKSGYPVGTIREWKGRKYIKVAPNKWKPKYDSESKGAKNSITRLMKQVENCKNVEELMNLVMENKQRFTDANGNHLPIVDKLRAAADWKNEELSGDESHSIYGVGDNQTRTKNDYAGTKNKIKKEDAQLHKVSRKISQVPTTELKQRKEKLERWISNKTRSKRDSLNNTIFRGSYQKELDGINEELERRKNKKESPKGEESTAGKEKTYSYETMGKKFTLKESEIKEELERATDLLNSQKGMLDRAERNGEKKLAKQIKAGLKEYQNSVDLWKDRLDKIKDGDYEESESGEKKESSSKNSKPVSSAYAPSESTDLDSKTVIASNKSIGDGEVEMPYSKELDAEIKSLNSNRSTDQTRYFMNHVYYDDGNLIATDGRRMKTIKVGELEGIPNGSYVDVASSKDGVKIKAKEVTNGDGEKAKFPGYKQVIPSENTQKVSLDNNVLKDKLKTMLKDGSIDKKVGRVALEFRDDGVFVDGTKVGNASNIKLKSGMGFRNDGVDTNNIFVNANYLLDALTGNESTLMLSDNAGKAMSIGTGSTNNIIMPMNPVNDTDPNKLPDYEAGRKAKNEENESKVQQKAKNKKAIEDYMNSFNQTQEQIDKIKENIKTADETVIKNAIEAYTKAEKKFNNPSAAFDVPQLNSYGYRLLDMANKDPEFAPLLKEAAKKYGIEVRKSLYDDLEEDYEEEFVEKSVDGSMDLFESVNIAETVRSVLSEII